MGKPRVGAPHSQIKAAGFLNSRPLTGPLSPIGPQFPFACAFLSRCETVDGSSEKGRGSLSMAIAAESMRLPVLENLRTVKSV
jgi:hypothetical protein